MECPTCQGSTRRFGLNRNGSQRYRCDACRRTFTDEATRPDDGRRLGRDKAIMTLRMLLEGNSIRSTERLIEVHRDTIIALMIRVGEACQRWMAETIQGCQVNDVQCDELWAFVGMKEKTRVRLDRDVVYGDCYCFTAIERDSKLLLAWHMGKRSPEDTREFAERLSHATSGRFQLTTDGYTPYRNAMPATLGGRIDFAQLVKVYANSETEGRYSPGEVVDTYAVQIEGDPDEDFICTSHVERHNLTIRMQIRRYTRLTNAFSKKWTNHEAMLGLFFAYYNFCRVHMTLTESTREEEERPLRKITPAMAAGLTDHVWSVAELLAVVGR